jgi:hypothetical protein
MPDESEFMTVAQFAELPSDAQIAVWQAHAAGRVEAVPEGGIYRYRRDQVLALLGETEIIR